MNTTNTITNQQERKEAIAARLDFVLESSHTSTPKSKYTLPSTGKQIDFAKQKNSWKLGRLIWRIGELRITACRDKLLNTKPLLETELEKYSFIWTLGRIGKTEDAAVVKEVLNANLESDTLIAVCFQSLLLLDVETDIKKGLLKDIPEKVVNSIKNNLFDDLLSTLQVALTPDKCNNWLYWLYLLHWETPKVKAALQSLLSELPLKGNYFKPFRKILKAAEHFEDMETLALLYWKIQHSDAYCNVLLRGDWERKADGTWYQKDVQKFAVTHGNSYQSVPLKEVLKAASSDFGFTLKSKKYFKTRFLRILFRSGDADSPLFTTLATAYLLQVKDEQAKAAYSDRRYTYVHNDTTNRWESRVQQLYYPIHSDKVAMYRLLYTNSEQYLISSASVRILKDKKATAGRTELFPELWNAAPRAIIRLLAGSKAVLIQDFAATVFEDNPNFVDTIQSEDVIQMLARPYLKTQQIAIVAIRKNYAQFEQEKAVFLALLDCGIVEGQQLAINWLNTRKKTLLEDLEFITHLIIHPQSNANKWIASAINTPDFAAPQKPKLLQHLLQFIQVDSSAEHIQNVLAFIETHLKSQAQQVSEQELRQLVGHPSPVLNLFAAKLMQQHKKSITKLPSELLLQLMESEHPEVRAAGIELFGQLPEEELYRQQVVVSNCCVSPIEEVRQAIKPTALKLSQKYPDFGLDLSEILSDFLLMRGKANDVHTSIAELLATPEMKAFIVQFPTTKMWRLLRSKKYPTQQVGFAILAATTDSTKLDMEDIVALGKHELKAVRVWAQEAIQQQATRAVYEADKTLRLLETDWEDSRHFMMQFATTEFKARDWTPELLVSLCDSTRDEVQAFGLQQIQTYFKEENAIQFLNQLSQHPAARVQLMATVWLEEHASNNLEQLRKLSPFFLTILSQINKSRSAKKYVYAFLEEEALRAPEFAEVIIPMLERLVLTVAVGDRANCILLLNKVRRKYPHLTMRLQANKLEVTKCET